MTFTFLGIFAAGVLTFLSPCVLPLAPILIASLLLSDSHSRWDRLRATLWFTTGFSLVFIIMGMSLPFLSHALGSAKPWLLGLAGLILALFGAKMMKTLPEFRWPKWMSRTFQVRGFPLRKLPGGLHGLLFGALFGLSWTPCVGPVLGGVLTFVASQEATPLDSALKLLPFAFGVSLPLLVIAVASEATAPLLQRIKRHLPKIEYATGLALFIFGAYILTQARFHFAAPQSATPSGNTPIVAISDSGSRVVLNSENKDLARMVFFYSENCPVCHAMDNYLPHFEKNCSSESFELVRVNIDRVENFQAAQYFNVKAIPTISVLNESGHELIHLVGYQTEGRLRDAAKTTTELVCKAPALPLPDKGTPAGGTKCNTGSNC